MDDEHAPAGAAEHEQQQSPAERGVTGGDLGDPRDDEPVAEAHQPGQRHDQEQAAEHQADRPAPGAREPAHEPDPEVELGGAADQLHRRDELGGPADLVLRHQPGGDHDAEQPGDGVERRRQGQGERVTGPAAALVDGRGRGRHGA
ncbi:hypothetical protein [Pseudonocardia sp. NPDC046786]|uniref:hypothetical protein n=1 Tax=Pseudonocardia sp. NPDC046786 TaxID=3155471 RepID=UPI0033DFA818